MKRTVKSGLVAGMVAMLALSGCRHPGSVDPYGTQQSGIGQLDGVWSFVNQNNQQVIVDVRRTGDGIFVSARGGESVFYSQVGPTAFSDPRGRVIEFYSDVEGVFRDPGDGRFFPMRRVG